MQPVSVVSHYQVLIRITQSGPSFHCTTTFVFDATQRADTVRLHTGDQISWIVLVAIAGRNATLPYKLTFDDPGIFGLTEISVPNGGFSSPVTVLALDGNTHYSVSVSGIPGTIDPEIQVDNGSTGKGNGKGKGKGKDGKAAVAPSSYSVVWVPAPNGPGTMQYQVDNGPLTDFPATLDIFVSDTVVFTVENTPNSFLIDFTDDSVWASPFCQNTFEFQSHPSGASQIIDNLTVQDFSNPHPTYTFAASQGSAMSNSYAFNVKPQNARDSD